MLQHLTIDPEFASKVPPLREEEFKQLEENILADGVVINPLIVWNSVIVDGHNRYHILQQHPEIQFTTYEKEFPDRYAAIAWICKNQLGRRNLTQEQYKYLIGERYEAEKRTESFYGNRFTLSDKSSRIQNRPVDHLPGRAGHGCQHGRVQEVSLSGLLHLQREQQKESAAHEVLNSCFYPLSGRCPQAAGGVLHKNIQRGYIA